MDAFYASVEQRDDPSLRGQAGGRRRQPGRARRRRGGELRGARTSASAPPSRWPAPFASAPHLVIVRPGLLEDTRPPRKRCSDLPLGDAAGRSRCRSTRRISTSPQNAWGETLGRSVAERLKREIKARHRPDGVRRRGAEQVPREDRVGVAEAGRPDGDRARARREVPPGTAGRRAVGRGPVTAAAAARARHRTARRCPHRRSRRCCATRSAAAPTGCGGSPTGIDDRPVEPDSEREVGRQREHLRQRSHRPERDPPRDRRDGARRRRLAREERACCAAR